MAEGTTNEEKTEDEIQVVIDRGAHQNAHGDERRQTERPGHPCRGGRCVFIDRTVKNGFTTQRGRHQQLQIICEEKRRKCSHRVGKNPKITKMKKGPWPVNGGPQFTDGFHGQGLQDEPMRNSVNARPKKKRQCNQQCCDRLGVQRTDLVLQHASSHGGTNESC